MNVPAMLTRARGLHEQVMVDACVITRAELGALDEDTGTYPPTTTTIYTGPCRFRPAGTATVEAATIGVDATRPTLDLPWTATAVVLPGDRVEITSGPLSGTVAEVYAEVTGTTSTSRRYTLEVRA